MAVQKKTHTQAKERAVLYARVSTEMQAEEGFSIEEQLRQMRLVAQDRGWIVVSEVVDRGISGRSLKKREGIQTVLQMARNREFDILAVYDLSRLSRSMIDTLLILNELSLNDVTFISITEPNFDLTTPQGRLFLKFIANFNEYYLELLSQNTKTGKRGRVAAGFTNASIPPFGYRHVPPKSPEEKAVLEINPDEAKGVRLAFELYATGNYSDQDIADILNSKGYRTRRGRHFSRDTVRDMLCNPFYKGKVVYREGHRRRCKEIHDGKHKPIVSPELWERVQKMRAQNRHRSSDFQPKNRNYILSKISHCHICKRTLRAQNTREGLYYREMSRARGYFDCPHSQRGARGDILHKQIGSLLSCISIPEGWREDLRKAAAELDSELTHVEERRQRLLNQRRKLRDMWLHGDFEGEEDEYRKQMDHIKRALELLPSPDEFQRVLESAQLVSSLGEIWEEATSEEQREITRLLLKRVEIDVVNARIVRFIPYVPFVPLFRAEERLFEEMPGVFVPVWKRDDLRNHPHYEHIPLVNEVPKDLVAPPFLLVWPWKGPIRKKHKIPMPTPLLKKRAEAGLPVEQVLFVETPGAEVWRLNERKWPSTSLRRCKQDEVASLPARSADLIYTPFWLQGVANRTHVLELVSRVLSEEGSWVLVDIAPSSMPAHWIFRFFPEARIVIDEMYWSSRDVHTALRKAGFEVKLLEAVFTHPLSVHVAYEVARRRNGVLQHISEEAFEKGLRRLEKLAAEKGENYEIESEVVLFVAEAKKLATGDGC